MKCMGCVASKKRKDPEKIIITMMMMRSISDGATETKIDGNEKVAFIYDDLGAPT